MVSYKLTTLLVAATLSLGVFAAVDTSGSQARKAVNVPRSANRATKAAAAAGAGAGAGAGGVDDLPEEDLGMGPPPTKSRKASKPAGRAAVMEDEALEEDLGMSLPPSKSRKASKPARGAAAMEDEAFEAPPPTKVRKTGKAAGAGTLAGKMNGLEDLETDPEALEGAGVGGMDEASLEDGGHEEDELF